ncbi:MAG: hypothetical protein AAF547_00010 [Actinomycetota bacterium]
MAWRNHTWKRPPADWAAELGPDLLEVILKDYEGDVFQRHPDVVPAGIEALRAGEGSLVAQAGSVRRQ